MRILGLQSTFRSDQDLDRLAVLVLVWLGNMVLEQHGGTLGWAPGKFRVDRDVHAAAEGGKIGDGAAPDALEVNVSALVFFLLPRHAQERPLDIVVDH